MDRSTGRTPTRQTGLETEAYARRYLERNGLRTITRNYRTRMGEIDLVMQERSTLVFVEVRFRRRSDFGSAAETVTIGKQRRIRASAQHFLLRHDTAGSTAARFDVVALSPARDGTHDYDIDWIKNAF